MTILFTRASNPIWFMVDLDGLPLNDEYFAFFLSNVFPYTPQPVYLTPNGPGVWSDPIQFFPNGTLPDNMYFDSTLVYRIEIRHGNSQTDPLVYEINDFVPGNGGSSSSTVVAGFGDNQISSTQFAEVNFVSPFNITLPGTYSVAPGWDLILTGSGTSTVIQKSLIPDDDEINNPNFALDITTAGWTTANLVQRFNHNGAIWSSITGVQDGYISMSVTAVAQVSSYNLTYSYKPSSGLEQQIGLSGTITTGNFQVLDRVQLLTPSDNTDTSTIGYVDIVISLQSNGRILLSNIQVVGQALPSGTTPAPLSPPYQQETVERAKDHLFHYYADSLIMLPKTSILTAWNFSLNPFQFITPVVTNAPKITCYICDQTLIHQEVADQIMTGEASAADRYGLQIIPVNSATTTRFAVIQFIDTSTILPYWSYTLSAMARLRLNSSLSSSIGVKMCLLWRASAVPIIGNGEPIVGWSANNLIAAGGWTIITPVNDPTYLLTNSSSETFDSISFNGFQMPDASTATMSLAVVLYTTSNMNSTTGSRDFFVLDKISLVPNDFAVDTQPQTFDDVMRQCQFYYEKSYDYNVYFQNGGTATDGLERQMTINRNGSSRDGFATPFAIEFNSIKRAAPSINLYAFNGATDDLLANVRAYYYQDGAIITNATSNVVRPIATYWTAPSISTKGAIYSTTTSPGILTTGSGYTDNATSTIQFQYTANALLGYNFTYNPLP